MRLDWFSRRLGAAMVLALGCTAPLAAQERETPRQTEALDVQVATQDVAEVTALRGEVQELRRDVKRLIELLETRTARPQVEERSTPVRKPAIVGDKRRSQHRQEETYTVTYNVADLIVPIGKMVTVDASGKQIQEGMPLTQPGDLQGLKTFITSRVRPNSWDAKGGPGAIQEIQNKLSLVISQTKAAHQEIGELLAQVRRVGLRQVSLKARCITLHARATDLISLQSTERMRLVGADQAQKLLDFAQSDRRSNTLQAPTVTLFSGQTASLQLSDSAPFGKLDLLVNAAIGKGRHSVRLRIAVNAKDKLDVLSSSDSVNVPGGHSVLLELSDETAAATNDNGLLSNLNSGVRAQQAAATPDERSVRRLILVTPQIVEDEEEEELLGIPGSP